MATKLDDEDFAGIALFLLARREEARLISDVEALPPLSDIKEVYSIHSKMAETQSSLGAHVGWKCGACNNVTLEAYGLEEPFRAPLFQGRIYTDPPVFDRLGCNVSSLEATFAFVLKRDLPPLKGGKKYTAETVWAAVDLVAPSIEVVGTRWTGLALEASCPLQRIADAGMNDSVVIGDAFEANAAIWRDLGSAAVRFVVNGKEAASGAACETAVGSARYHPAQALAWLANELIAGNSSTAASQYGGGGRTGLLAGDLVNSGAVCVLPAAAFGLGDTVTADFTLGPGTQSLVSLQFGESAQAKM
jgi:2-keto-4-pentenoate hydratase